MNRSFLQSALHSTTTRTLSLTQIFTIYFSNCYLSLLLFFNLVRTRLLGLLVFFDCNYRNSFFLPAFSSSKFIILALWLASFCLVIQAGWSPPSPSSKIWYRRGIGKNRSANEAGYAAWIGGVPAHPDPHQVSYRICSRNSRRYFSVSCVNLARKQGCSSLLLLPI